MLPPPNQSFYRNVPPGFFLPPIPPPIGTPNAMPPLPPPFQYPPNLTASQMASMPFMPPSALLLRDMPPPNLRNMRPKRKDGMPSMRTISDFACDPFAGFMSKKEKEWLVKIQIIQCLGTGDSFEDDYYYAVSISFDPEKII